METTLLFEKQERVKALFAHLTTNEERYQAIIDLGRTQKPLSPEFKTPHHLVKGCQSKMYLKTVFQDGLLYFETESDALISAGLGMLLVSVYSEQSPEIVLTQKPHFIEEIGLYHLLSPSRSNGLASLYLRMQHEALIAFKT